jgi:hypothetical protein
MVARKNCFRNIVSFPSFRINQKREPFCEQAMVEKILPSHTWWGEKYLLTPHNYVPPSPHHHLSYYSSIYAIFTMVRFNTTTTSNNDEDMPSSYQKGAKATLPSGHHDQEDVITLLEPQRRSTRRWKVTAALVVALSVLYLFGSTAVSYRTTGLLSTENAGGLWGKSLEAQQAKQAAKEDKDAAKQAAKQQKQAAKQAAKEEKQKAKEAARAEKQKAKQAKAAADADYLAAHPEIAEEKAAKHAYWKQHAMEIKDYWKNYGNESATYWKNYGNESAANWTAKGAAKAEYWKGVAEEYKAKFNSTVPPAEDAADVAP